MALKFQMVLLTKIITHIANPLFSTEDAFIAKSDEDSMLDEHGQEDPSNVWVSSPSSETITRLSSVKTVTVTKLSSEKHVVNQILNVQREGINLCMAHMCTFFCDGNYITYKNVS